MCTSSASPTPQAFADLSNAQREVQKARTAFEEARRKANADLDTAMRNYKKADDAFNTAREVATRALINARNDVINKQRE